MTISWVPLKRSLHANGSRRRQAALTPETIEVAPPMPSTCRVTMKPQLGVAVFGLLGELDATTAREVGVMLASAAGEANVLLDLTEIKVIDTEGVETLRDVIRCVHEQGGRVALSRPWRLAKPILGLVGTRGFVLLALSPAGAISWLDQHPRGQLAAEPPNGEVLPIAGTTVSIPVTQIVA
jgi:ABC-type transporter Mla MlaB component